ncbi:MAG: hypothetical protein Q4E57_04965 [Eubacteriales bacterium]|nr:hypothetical protein [Eubacteriales bacterium]
MKDEEKEMDSTAKKKGFPNAMVVVAVIMVICAILTWIIPAGKYDVIEGTKILDPATYHTVDRTPVGPWGLLQAVFGGMSSASNIIAFTFMVGGLFNVLIETKAVDGFVGYLVRTFGDRASLVIPVLVFIMSILGATGVMANPVVAVIPIGVILAKRLKLDQITAVAVLFLAAYGGYATSPMCPMTIQVAQKIADIPVMSGFGFRCVIWIVFFIPTVIYIMRYVRKISADPSSSIMGTESFANQSAENADIAFNLRHALALIGLAAGLGVYTYGSLKLGWGMQEMATIILIIAMFGAFITGLGVDGFIQGFLKGARQMAFSAMLIGLASGVSVILNSGNILHTIIFGLGTALNSIPHMLAGPLMYVFNLLFNFLVNSGSGQASVIMPVMAPLADVVGVTRQAAVTAFQLGDGLSNVIFPTSGTMMACLAAAGVDYKEWMKFAFPLFLVWAVMGFITVMIVVALGIA